MTKRLSASWERAEDIWQTPQQILIRSEQVLGRIDLDPCSSELANKKIQARLFFDRESDGIRQIWPERPTSVFCNPPLSPFLKIPRDEQFWDKLMFYRREGFLKQAIFVLRTWLWAQDTEKPHQFLTCWPLGDLRRGPPTLPAKSKNFALVYVPGLLDRSKQFRDAFRDIGVFTTLIKEPDSL